MKQALICCLLIGLAAAVAVPPAVAAIDPFYRTRMENGTRAFEMGNWDEAARQLRIACFGYLDEPRELIEGLVRLGLAEAARNDEKAFRKVFSRIADVEERVAAYREAQLPQALRGPFEEAAMKLVPAQRLRSVASFRALAERAELAKMAALPPPQRRTELEEILQAEPGRPGALIELARLELESRRPGIAIDVLDRLPASVSAEPRATCLRQQAATESKSCTRMDLSQPFCPGVLDSVIEFRLECLVAASRWQEAAALLAALPPASRAKRRIARLERRLDQRRAAADEPPPPAAAAPPEAAATASAEAASVPAATPPPRERPAPRPVDPAELGQLRERLAMAQTASQLESLMADAEQLARAHPASRSAQLLAAEIAYLRSAWAQSVAFFRRAGDLRPGEVHLAFYLAVALYETGEADAAAELLRPIASRLERTRFVGTYIDRILAAGDPAGPPGV